jgi:hypothetical protein
MHVLVAGMCTLFKRVHTNMYAHATCMLSLQAAALIYGQGGNDDESSDDG